MFSSFVVDWKVQDLIAMVSLIDLTFFAGIALSITETTNCYEKFSYFSHGNGNHAK